MKPVLVGSRALEFWLPDKFKCRSNADWDVWCEPEDMELLKDGSQRVEVHSFDELSNRNIAEEYYCAVPFEVNEVRCYVLGFDGLAIVKRSHLWRTHIFEKHITMYHKFLKEHLPTDSYSKELLKERTKLTMEAYPQNNNPLNKANEEFFDDHVEKKFDHDFLHELVAHYERPLFEKLKRKEKFDKAWCERDLWEELPYEDKLLCLSEEAHVIAAERFLIPSNWTYYRKPAYYKAVDKVCTTLTAGTFRDFALDNYPELLELYDEKKLDKVKEHTYEQN